MGTVSAICVVQYFCLSGRFRIVIIPLCGTQLLLWIFGMILRYNSEHGFTEIVCDRHLSDLCQTQTPV